MKYLIGFVIGIMVITLMIISGVYTVYADDPTPTPTTPTPQIYEIALETGGYSYNNGEGNVSLGVLVCPDGELVGARVGNLDGTAPGGVIDQYIRLRLDAPGSNSTWGMATIGWHWDGSLMRLNNDQPTFVRDNQYKSLLEGLGYTNLVVDSDFYGSSIEIEAWYHSNPTIYYNDVNIYGICYGIPPIPKQQLDCWDYYQIGDVVATDTVKPFNDPNLPQILWEGENGKAIPGIVGGKYYVLEVEYPYWMDGTGETEWHPSYKADISPFWSLAGAVEWYELSQYPNSCWQPLGDYGQGRLYFYADEQISDYLHGIRAHNEYGDYFDNLGLMHYTIKEAIYTPPPAACEANYDIGEFVNTIRVPAWYSDGLPVFAYSSPIPNTTYVIDISSEPWFDEEGKSHHDVDISLDGGTTWVNIRDVSGDCEADKGAGGYKYYFTYIPGRTYRIRASDGNNPLEYLGNKGYVKFSVYTATSYKSDNCSSSFTLGNLLKSGSIPANLSDGDNIQYNLKPDNWYAIEISPPPWSNNGVNSKEADMSGGDSGWRTFYPIADYPGVACVEDLDGYKRIYIRAQYAQYLLRAHEDVLQYQDNSGAVNYKLYGVEVNASNPPPGSCESAYNTNRIVVSLPILYANLENGIELKLSPGKYMLETMEGPWLNESTPSYDVEITSGGLLGTYVPISSQGISDPLECVVPLSDGVHYRAYFSVEVGKYYRIRVSDPGGTYATNTGQMVIAIYRVTDINEPPPDPADYTINGCNSICVRPDSMLDIPEWIEYNRCAFSKWISICPHHVDSLLSVLMEFNNKEPFGTLLQFTSLPTRIREEFNHYRWAESQGGGEILGGTQPWEILAQLPSDSPFNNGRIEIIKPMTQFSTFCQNEMTKTVGSKLAAPMCFALNVLDGLGVNKWINTLFNLVLASIFIMYIYNAWIKQFGN